MSNTDNPGTDPLDAVDPIDAEPAESTTQNDAGSAQADSDEIAEPAASASASASVAASNNTGPVEPADSTDTTAYDVDADLVRPVSASNSVSTAHAASNSEWPEASNPPEPYAPTPAYTPGEAYTPAASVGAPSATPLPTPTPTPTPIYVQAPTPPKPKGNRAAGILIGLLASVVFALVYAAGSLAVLLVRPDGAGAKGAVDSFLVFAQQPVFWGTIIVFFLAFALIVAIVNRGKWVAYVLGGFGVGVLVYLGYIAVVMLQVRIWEFTPAEAGTFLGVQWLSPVAIIAGIVAREVTVWFGAWVAKRGRAVTERNAAARAEYERLIEAGPQLTRI